MQRTTERHSPDQPPPGTMPRLARPRGGRIATALLLVPLLAVLSGAAGPGGLVGVAFAQVSQPQISQNQAEPDGNGQAPARSRMENQDQVQPDDGTDAPADTVRAPARHEQADPLANLTPAERARLRALLARPAQDQLAKAQQDTKPAPAPAAAAAKPAASTDKVSLAPDSLAGEMLGEVAGLRAVLAAQAATFGHLFGDIALTGSWLHREMVNPSSRAELVDAIWRSALLLGVALLVEYGLLLALRRPLRALNRDAQFAAEQGEETEAEPPVPGMVQAGPPEPLGEATITPMPVPGDALPGSPILPAARPLPDPDLHGTSEEEQAERALRSARQAEHRSRDAAHRRRTLRLFRRLPFAVLRLVLKLVPLAAFLAIGNIASTQVADRDTTQLVIITIANLYGIGRAIWLFADMLLAPHAPGVRLTQLSDDTARFLSRWWSWLLALAVVAVCITDVGRVLDLPSRAATAIVRAVVLVEHILLAVLIWQTRGKVAQALKPPRRVRDKPLGRLLSRLAELWWIAALFFDAALWVVWAAQIRGGYAKMWQLFLNTLVIVLVCRLITVMLLGGLDRMFRLDGQALETLPGLERRAVRYYPAARRLVTWLLSIVCVIALCWGWGLPVLGFFTHGTLGKRLLSAGTTILIMLLVGVAVWELANGALDRQIDRFRDGNQAARAVRLQTLLPILRTLLMVVLGTVLVLTILGEIGVNIAPLLAGAGIIGVALGFGSQKLVQDFITGIFLLVENAMQVGDSVTVAGVSGTVEHLSIRTLRLRGGDGSIQIIPFSSVSTVANMSRDYAVASITVSVAFQEDTDRIYDLLRQIGAELREDPAFADMILADFGLNGVDSLGEYAVTISGTMRCTVGGRWPVQREFNRRLRMRIEQLGIAMPQPPRSVAVPSLPAILAAGGNQAHTGPQVHDEGHPA
ncbi:mechanosensitive ion channel [Acetobacteraceae bacterium KSS8]|uniref:Mechanosensitive ion channel n=1 Tax=Endosaccharibacter trunci TaxID=2812733 RepID=A0ABT1W3Z3_9PROT|nr:mechanosensitive ion channel [Acetobacteraceae bacterium KSS8]